MFVLPFFMQSYFDMFWVLCHSNKVVTLHNSCHVSMLDYWSEDGSFAMFCFVFNASNPDAEPEELLLEFNEILQTVLTRYNSGERVSTAGEY